MAASPVNHPGTLQPVSQPATPPPISDDDTVVVDVPAQPYNHVVEIVRLDGEVARLRAQLLVQSRLHTDARAEDSQRIVDLLTENAKLRKRLSTVLQRAIDDNNATPLRTWIRSFFGAALVLVFFVGACGDDTKRISPDAACVVDSKPDTMPFCEAAVCQSRQDAAP